MCIKCSWGPCFNSNHETMEADLLIQIKNRKACEKREQDHVCVKPLPLPEPQTVYPHAVSETDVLLPSFIRGVLRDNLPNYPAGVAWWLMDNEYRLASDEEIWQFIEWDLGNGYVYKPERRDCDKFARRFWSRFNEYLERNNVGFTVDWSGAHAYIVIARRNGGMWIYEPQDDRWWVPGDNGYEMPYPLDNVGILL